MTQRLLNLASSGVAIASGSVVLLAYFVELPLLRSARGFATQWAAALIAIALLVGIFNLFRLHGNRVLDLESGWPYSLVLLLGLFGTFSAGILATVSASLSGVEALANFQQLEALGAFARRIFDFAFIYVQSPLEGSLAALLAFVLVAAGARLARGRQTVGLWIFVFVSLLLLLGLVFSSLIPAALTNLAQVFAIAGSRGILLGLALGAIATGLRVVADRPYEE